MRKHIGQPDLAAWYNRPEVEKERCSNKSINLSTQASPDVLIERALLAANVLVLSWGLKNKGDFQKGDAHGPRISLRSELKMREYITIVQTFGTHIGNMVIGKLAIERR